MQSYMLAVDQHAPHFMSDVNMSNIVHLLVSQLQQMLKADEDVESYTDATPLRLLPCDGTCQKAKASIDFSPPVMLQQLC